MVYIHKKKFIKKKLKWKSPLKKSHYVGEYLIALEFTVDVIIGISVSADLSSQTSATTLFVSMSISPKTHTASLFNPLPTLYFVLKK